MSNHSKSKMYFIKFSVPNYSGKLQFIDCFVLSINRNSSSELLNSIYSRAQSLFLREKGKLVRFEEIDFSIVSCLS